MTGEQEISYELATPEEYEKISDFIFDNFNDMPLFTAFEITNDNKPPPSANGEEDFTVKAQTREGTIVGVAVNRAKIVYQNTEAVEQKWIQMRTFLQFVADDAKTSSLPERTIELRILSMNPEYRGRGIAKRLTEESMKIAKSRGFEVMKMCCTSEFTAKIARSLGWQEFYRLAYKDYGKVSSSQYVLKAAPPHEHIYYYITHL